MKGETEPPLSIVIAASEPWPAIRGCLDSLYDQARRAGAEIIVVDRTTQALPDDSRYEGVRLIAAPGRSVFQLRAMGLGAATGAIVAVTEDHCRVAPDWCDAILTAHREFPGAAAIGGAIENGSTGCLMDWAHFLASNDRFARPLPTGPRDDISGQACLSYKRRALPAKYPAVGMIEWRHHAELRARGETLLCDGRIAVDHVQSFTFWRCCRIHYDVGRAVASFHLETVKPTTRLLRIAKCLIVPLRAAIAAIRITARNAIYRPRHRRAALAAFPLLAALLCCKTTGELVGYLAGPGESPGRVN